MGTQGQRFTSKASGFHPQTDSKERLSLVQPGGFVAHVVMNGDGVLLRDKKPDPEFPPAGEPGSHLDEGAHERMGSFARGSNVGLFRHEDESLSPYFAAHVTIYPGPYRVRTSLWSFQWDKGAVLPARGTGAGGAGVFISFMELLGYWWLDSSRGFGRLRSALFQPG